MVISNGSFHCGVAAVQRPTTRSRADDELEFTPSCLCLISPGCTPLFPQLWHVKINPPFSISSFYFRQSRRFGEISK